MVKRRLWMIPVLFVLAFTLEYTGFKLSDVLWPAEAAAKREDMVRREAFVETVRLLEQMKDEQGRYPANLAALDVRLSRGERPAALGYLRYESNGHQYRLFAQLDAADGGVIAYSSQPEVIEAEDKGFHVRQDLAKPVVEVNEPK